MSSGYVPKRFIFAIMAHLGLFVVYALRVNLSVALVAMVNDTYSNSNKADPECHRNKNQTISKHHGEFNWDQTQQGYILSSFFYGYLFTQFPGGWIANRFGGKHVFGGGVFITAVLTLLTPIAARTSFYLFLAVRILIGVAEGVTFPAMHSLIAQWSPPADRSKFVFYAFGGMYSGTIFSMPISGLLASSNFLGGWPSVFYVFGAAGVLWYLFWLFFVYDTPDQHPTINHEEKTYLKDCLQKCSLKTKKVRVPWLKILTSVHVWAITIAHFSNNWVWYMVLTGLPSYFKQVLDFNLRQNGFLSALPFIAAYIGFNVAGVLSDILRRKRLSTKSTRRLMSALAIFPSAAFLVLASFTGCNYIGWSVACMVLSTGLLAINGSGYLVNHLDIGPRFSGILMGISNTPGTIAGCLTPLVTGYFTNNHPTTEQYRKVFFIAAAICVTGGLLFIVFLSGEVQPWNDIPDEEETEQGEKKRLINSCDDHPHYV